MSTFGTNARRSSIPTSPSRAAPATPFEPLETRQLLSGSVATSAADNALAYDPGGTLHVAYYDAAAHNLKYMSQSPSGTWSSATTVDSTSPDVGQQVSIAVAPNGSIGVAYLDATNHDLKYARLQNGQWKIWTVDSKKDTGVHPSLTFDSSSSPIISYYRPQSGDLKLATYVKSKWKLSVLSSKGDVGLYSSIAVSPSGDIAVVYESSTGHIEIAEQKAGKKKFSKPVRVDNQDAGNTGVSLAFDADGKPAFSYYDAATGTIKLAREGTNGTFSVTPILTVPPSSNPGATLLFDNTGNPVVVYYDASKDGLFLAKSDGGNGSGDFDIVQLKANTGGSTKAVIQPNNGSITYTFADTEDGSGGLVLDNTETTPALPTNIAATPNSSTQVTVTWTDKSSNETSFIIERSTDGTNFTTVATLPPNTTSFLDTNLTEATVYYYRVYSVGGSGEKAIGSAQSVVSTTTLAAAPTALSVGTVTVSTIALSWTDNSSGETGFSVYRSTDGGATYPLLATTGSNVNTYTDSGLSEGATYRYRVAANNASGQSAFSNVVAGTAKPAAPTNVSAAPVSATRIDVTWTNASSHATAFVVERSTDGATFSPVATPGPSATSYSDTGLVSAGTYYYRVATVANGVQSAYSGLTNAVTDAAAPSGLTATAVSTTRIDLSWTDNTGGETGFRVQRSVNGGDFTTLSTLNPDTTSFSDLTVAEGASYGYRVKALSGGTDSAYSSAVSAMPLPSAPTSPSAALVQGVTGVVVSWTDAASGETGFEIERSVNGGTTWTPVGTAAANATSYNDTTAAEATNFVYRVRSANGSGNSAFVTTPSVTTLPAAATGLTAAAASATQIGLTWIDNSSGETGFVLQRSIDNGATWADAATLDADVTSYDDASLAAGTTYNYRVFAFNSAGQATSAATASAVTRALAPANLDAEQVSPTRVDLTWDASAGATGYQIERALAPDGEWTLLDSLDTTSFSDFDAVEGTNYQYRVIATNDGGASTPSNTAMVTTPPAAPSDLAAAAVSTTQVNLSWTDNSSGETGYEVERSTDNGTTFTYLATAAANATGYSDTTASEGSTYVYRVRGVNAGGSSDYTGTATASAKPAAPTSLSATPSSPTQVDLTWTDNSAHEINYLIERSPDGNAWGQIGTAAAGATSYSDQTAVEGTSYSYRVRAAGSNNTVSDYSDEQPAVTPAAAPTALTAAATSTTTVHLSWTNNSTHNTGFRIERSDDDGATFTPIDQVAADVTAYDDANGVEGTSYQYRVTALRTYANDSDFATFSVATPPNTPTGLQATAVNAGQVSLAWTDESGHETGFKIERSDDGGDTWTQIDSVVSDVESYDDMTANAGTTYQYRIRAYTAATNGAYTDATDVTLIPGAPQDLQANVAPDATVDLSWTDVAGETGYKIERSDDNGVNWNPIGTSPAGQAEYHDGTTVELASYQYRVRGYNGTGDGAYSDPQAAATFVIPPGNLGIDSVGTSQVTLSWSDNSSVETGFDVERSTDGGDTWSPLTSVGAGVETYSDTGLPDGTEFQYRVRATDGVHDSGWAGPVTGVTRLASPTGFNATPVTPTRIDLDWADNSANETGFRIMRSNDGGNTYALAGTAGAGETSFSDTGVTEGTSYDYALYAVNTLEDATSTPAATTTSASAPTAPSALQVTGQASTRVDLSWTDNSSKEVGFRIDRSDDNGSSWAALDTVDPDTTTFSDTTELEAHAYQYRVVATGPGVASAAAGPVSVLTLPAAPTGLTAVSTAATTVHLAWTDNSSGEDNYRVDRREGGSGPFTAVATLSAETDSYDDSTSVSGGTSYTYRVVAVNASGDSEVAELSVLTRPATPADFTATPLSATRVDLAWTDVTGEAQYLVERSADAGSTWTPLDTPEAGVVTYSDTAAAGGTTYLYRVTARNDAGDGVAAVSDPVLTVPSDPANLAAAPVSATQIDLSWDDVLGETGYTIQRKSGAGAFGTLTTRPAGTTSYSDTTADPGSSYTYRVLATNGTGASAGSSTVDASSLPAAPTNFHAVATSLTSVDLTWDAVVSATGYHIQRSDDAGSTWADVTDAGSGDTSFSDESASEGNTYTYRINATNAAGSGATADTSVTMLPTAAAALTGTAASATQIDLTWTDNSGGETGYNVYRSTDNGVTFAFVTTTAADATSYSDTGAVEGTTYVYKVIPANAAGEGEDVQASATTLPASPAALAATPISSTAVNFTWTDNAAHETSQIIERSTDGGTTWGTIATPAANATTYLYTTATPGQTAKYRVRAVQDGQQSAPSNVLNQATVPGAVSGTTASAFSQTRIDLTWTDVSGETGYMIQRSTDGGDTWSVLGSAAANATSYSDTTATEATAYAYRLFASNGAGFSTAGNTATATSLANAPSVVTTTAVSPTQIDVGWTDNSSGETGFELQRSNDNGSTWSTLTAPSANATSYSDTAVSAGNVYTYRVRAVNAGGNSAFATSSPVATIPAQVSSFSATAAGATQVDLTWADAAAETGYEIERSTDAGSTWSPLTSPVADTTSYNDSGALEGTSHLYRIRAVNGTGNGAWNTLSSPVLTVPAAPTGATASPVSATQVDLTWADVSNHETGYKVERTIDGGDTWTVVAASLPAGTTSASDTSAAPGTLNEYRVSATNAAGHSDYSTDSATTVPAPTFGVTAESTDATHVTVTWTDVTGETGYRVERSDDAGSSWNTVTTKGADVTSATDATVTEATPYVYRVISLNGTGDGDASNEFSIVTIPATPTGLGATPISAGQVDLLWTDHSGGETAYSVFRSDDGGDTWALLTDNVAPGADAYSDTTVSGGTSYQYRVAAINNGGSSAFSNTDTVLTHPDAPGPVTIDITGQTTATVNWTNVLGETGYEIERSNDNGSTWGQVATRGPGVVVYHDAGLTEGTTYLYRVRAVNGTGNGGYATSDPALTQPGDPTSLSTTPLSATRVDLTWTDNSGGEDGFKIERSDDAGDNWTEIGTSVANDTTYSDTTVAGGTSYVYRVRAVNTSGYSDYSNADTALTVPAAPGNVHAAAASPTSITITWDDVTGETGYTVYHSDDGGSNWTSAGTTTAGDVDFTDTGLTEATPYTYKLVAANGTGDGAESLTASATTLPLAPSALAASPITTNSVTLTWTDNSANATGYKVERSDDGGDTWSQVGDTLAGDTTYADTGLTEATTFAYRVMAYTAGGNSAATAPLTVDTKPLAPTSLTAATAGDTQIDLQWVDNSSGETGFKIDRSNDNGSIWDPVVTLDADVTTYSDATTSEATEYIYRVYAYRGSSTSAYSNLPSATTLPAAPTGLGATAASPTRIDLTWFDNSAGETGYKVERSTDAGETWSTVDDTLPADAQSYSDMSAPEAATSYYRVTAIGGGGESTSISAAHATTPLAAPTSLAVSATAPSSVTLDWTDNSGVETGYKVERSEDGGTTWTEIFTTSTDAATYTDTDVTEDVAYTYRVRASNGVVNSAYSNTDSDTTPLIAPGYLSASSAAATQVDLTWIDGSGAEEGFSVERSDDGGSTWNEVGTTLTGTTHFSDTSVSEATPYVYRVRATNTDGNTSGYTGEFSVTTIPATPTSVASSAFSTTQIDLTWADNSSGESAYEVERSDDGGNSFSLLVSRPADTTSYSDVSAAEGSDYVYRVRAVGAGGNSADSTVSNVTTPPAAPDTLDAAANSATSVTLTWADQSNGETGYQIERSDDGGSTWGQIDLVDPGTTSYDDTVGEAGSYQYRVRAARNAVNSDYSNTASVATVPAAPTAGSVSVPTTTRVVINWTDNSSGETGYRIERSTNGGAFAFLNNVAAGIQTYSDNTVSEGSSYAYRVRAYNAAGDSLWSQEMGAFTAPSAPSGLSASASSSTAVALSWTDNSSRESGYKIERSNNGGTTWAEIDTVSANVTSYNDGGLTESTSYQYRVRAYNANANSAYSSSAGATTKLNAPTNLAAVTASATRIDLTWTDNSSNESSYKVERSTDNATWSVVGTTSVNATSYADSTAIEATTYYYRVRAYRTTNQSAYAGSVSATTLPAAPSSASATVASATQVNLTWTDNSAGETGFTVERSADGGSTWSVLSSAVAASATSYSDTTATEGTAYKYRVKANGAGGSSGYSTTSSVTTLPAAPSALDAASSEPDRVTLTWADNSSVETGYKIERSDDGGSSWTQIDTVGTSVTSYEDVTVDEATPYRYRVRATISGLNSAFSNEDAVTTIPLAPTDLAAATASTTQVDLTWTNNSLGADSYRVERSTDGGNSWSEVASVGPNATSYSVVGGTEGTFYQYRVRAEADGGFSAYTDTVDATTLPSAPTGFAASASSATTVDLSWTDASSGESGYRIERSDNGGSTWAEIDEIGADSSSYTDSTASASTAYDYRIRAFNAGGNSAYSNVQSVTTPA